MQDITKKIDANAFKNRSNFKAGEIYRAQVEQATKDIIKEVAAQYLGHMASFNELIHFGIYSEQIKDDDGVRQILVLKYKETGLGELKKTVGKSTWLFFTPFDVSAQK